jgi:polyhydroxyalkanoate synthesis regulator phasin
MIDQKTIQKIEEFVASQPRSMQEISTYMGKNWRTIDRYIDYIKKEIGTVETKTFREGTRGALKIVFLTNVEKISSTAIQKQLEESIYSAKTKEDFSAFDIFQNVDSKNKKITIETEYSKNENNKELNKLLKDTKKELLIFSGNLSWINLNNKEFDFIKSIEELVKKGVRIKILSRVDIAGIDNLKKMLSINKKTGSEFIEIRHYEQPLRAIISDEKILRIKEIKEPTGKVNELKKRLLIFYTIQDKNWVNWLSKIFKKMFYNSIGAEKRIEEMNKYFNL